MMNDTMFKPRFSFFNVTFLFLFALFHQLIKQHKPTQKNENTLNKNKKNQSNLSQSNLIHSNYSQILIQPEPQLRNPRILPQPPHRTRHPINPFTGLDLAIELIRPRFRPEPRTQIQSRHQHQLGQVSLLCETAFDIGQFIVWLKHPEKLIGCTSADHAAFVVDVVFVADETQTAD